MTVLVCLFDDNSWARQNDWDYVLSHFRPDGIYLCEGADPDWVNHTPMRDSVPISSVTEIPGGLPLVVLSPLNAKYLPGVTNLRDFVHPPSAVYMFGPDNRHLGPEHLGGITPHDIVYIENDTVDQMYSHAAALVCFYDRRAKGG